MEDRAITELIDEYGSAMFNCGTENDKDRHACVKAKLAIILREYVNADKTERDKEIVELREELAEQEKFQVSLGECIEDALSAYRRSIF